MTNPNWPIDLRVLAQTAGPNAAQLLPQLIPIYLEDGELLIGWMADAIQTNDALKLGQATHRLKGNSASLGVLTLAALAQDLELLGQAEDLVAAIQSFTALSDEYAKVKFALLDMISQVE